MSDNIHDKSHISEALGSESIRIFQAIKNIINRSISSSDNVEGFLECGLEAAFDDSAWQAPGWA